LLLIESGLRILSIDQRADHDQFLVEVAPVWRARRAAVQVFYRALTETDVRSLDALTRERGFADAVLLEAFGGADSLTARAERVQIVHAAELVERLQGAALIAWQDDKPEPSLDRFSLVRRFGRLLPALDTVGLRWLVPLSLNKVPQELAHLGQPADRLFEQAVFRVFSSVFRFGGHRLGSRRTGHAMPDAILRGPSLEHDRRFSALLDCKAAGEGYLMSKADERALVDYVHDFRVEAESDGDPLRYIVVVSSSFAGDRARYPYLQRAATLQKKTGARLAYLRASDLLVLAMMMEQG
jgi:hypothetical protein